MTAAELDALMGIACKPASPGSVTPEAAAAGKLLAAELFRRRVALGLSRADLATLAGLKRLDVVTAETVGRVRPEKARRIVDALKELEVARGRAG